MRDIPEKQDYVSDLLPAAEFNSNQDELENAVTTTGQTLDSPGGPDNDLFMLSKAMSAYGSGGGEYYVCSGSGSTFILSTSGSFQRTPGYFDGMLATFKATFSNVGSPAYANVNGFGSREIKFVNGDPITNNYITAGQYIRLVYNSAGSDFRLLEYGAKRLNNAVYREYFYTTSGSFDVPDGVTNVQFSLYGAGGGGDAGLDGTFSPTCQFTSSPTNGGNTTMTGPGITAFSASGGNGGTRALISTGGSKDGNPYPSPAGIISPTPSYPDNGVILPGKGAKGGKRAVPNIGEVRSSNDVTANIATDGQNGSLVIWNKTVSSGQTYTYTITAGGDPGTASVDPSPGKTISGTSGSPGFVKIAYLQTFV
jgi:hypothetical protein